MTECSPLFGRHLIVTIVRSPGTSQEHRQENVYAGGTVDTNALFYPDTDIKRGDEIHAAHLDEPRVVTAVHPKTALSGALTHYEVELVPLSAYQGRQIVHNQRSTSWTLLGGTSSKEVSKIVQIFLCHANEDKPQVRKVYQHLTAEGFQPWLDEEDLLPGQLWRQEIPKMLRSSDFILIFLSETSIRKIGYVQNEFKLAIDAWKQIPEGMIHTIPVRLDHCQVPEQFREFHWVDLFDERGFERLLRAIRTGLEQRQSPQRSHREAVASAQTKDTYVNMGIDALPHLTLLDTFILKLSCEASIEIGNIYIETSAIVPKAAEANIPHSEVCDSIDVLARKSYVETTRNNEGIAHFSITLSGFEAYANHFIPDYQAICQLVISKMVNEDMLHNKSLSSEINQPIRVIDHILRVLQSQNLFNINSTLAGYEEINASNISPELRRMLGNNPTP